MELNSLTIMNFNASRTSNLGKIDNFLQFLGPYNPSVVNIQEINVKSALKMFSSHFQVIVNIEIEAKDGIGIVTLIKKGIQILDTIIGKNGRIIGIKVMNVQIWNVYPKSGSAFKNERETFFREELCALMMNWKDATKYVFQTGDHNCTHRASDSLHNRVQHLQPALIKHMKIHGLSDDFLNVHGDIIMYSRITNVSRTRIDYILSNSKACYYFQYIDMLAGLDHKVAIGKYDIQMESSKEYVPKNRFFPGWVISKRLEHDKIFSNQAKFIFETVLSELNMSASNRDPSFYWLKSKCAVIQLAKDREKELLAEENFQLELLQGYYQSILEDIANGRNCYQELENIKLQLDSVYQARSTRKVERMRCLEIDNHLYDLHKLQNQRKYENQTKLRTIKIGEVTYEGTENVVNAIEGKIKKELKCFDKEDFDAAPSDLEEFFLSKLNKISLSEEEMKILEGPTQPDEISFILENEVDLDSSPGEDGITYRLIKSFWKWSEYRELYLRFLNFTRTSGSCGVCENIGIMTVKNKKAQSTEYDKKRKLTKLNKDTNLGNGKVWVNRIKKIIIPKVLPRNQFNCQLDVNIVDEIREIRTVNSYLLGDENAGQMNGTICSIDFKDAFRSVSLRWFNLVMKQLGLPESIINWFWAMYKELYIVVVINRCTSAKIKNERGFLEGHPPSMLAFVISLIPMMLSLEEVMSGIVTRDGKRHKIKLFADDLKGFIGDIQEIDRIYDVICKFENISGLIMHRDPKREKCVAIPFGDHKEYQNWPEWVTVKNKIKVVGAVFSNDEHIDKFNSDLVEKSFFNALQKSYGVVGTIFQKVYFVNTYLFSKIWYLAQCFKLDNKMLDKILSKALDFIYAGENERPVRALNFRPKDQGGLGLIHPKIKAKAFLIKNMYYEFLEYNCSIRDDHIVRSLHGYNEEFVRVYMEGLSTAPVKEIYNFLLQDMLYKNGSLIPSRNEKRSQNVKWSVVFKNLSLLKGVTSEEKTFAWKVSQDMLPVGTRLHRKNAERRCMLEMENNFICLEDQNLEHFFIKCRGVANASKSISNVLEHFIGQKVNNDLIYFSFNHRNKKKLVLAIWFSVKAMYKIYQNKCINKAQLLVAVIKEIEWNLERSKYLGSLCEMLRLKSEIIRELGT